MSSISERKILSLHFVGGERVKIDYLFTTRGDIFHTDLATQLGAELDEDGQITVDRCLRTSVPHFYAAGCVTPANCQMIIAAGQGATAAQAINRDLFEENLESHSLRRFREVQLRAGDDDSGACLSRSRRNELFRARALQFAAFLLKTLP